MFNAKTKKRISFLKARIAELQEIQKTHPSTSFAWMQSSELLEPLFAEMAVLTNGQPI